MKINFVRNLEPGSIVAKDVLNGEGKILAKEGTELTRANINFLRRNMVLYIYIEDSALEDIDTDPKLDKLKQKTLAQMPSIFFNISSGDYVKSKESVEIVENLIDYMIENESLNTNVYEIRSFDNYTYIHCLDTAIMAAFMGISMEYKSSKIRDLCISALFHDIGKLKISNEIINKKGKLTNEEFEEIKKHPFYGKQMLKDAPFYTDEIIRGVYEHHERIDGKGYPKGLKKNEISEFAKVISICDVFTAVSANRSYRKRFSPNEAYELILSGSNTKFDEKLVQKFRNVFYIYPLGACVKLSNGAEGYVVRQNKSFADRPVIRILYDADTKLPIHMYEINLLRHTDIIIESII